MELKALRAMRDSRETSAVMEVPIKHREGSTWCLSGDPETAAREKSNYRWRQFAGDVRPSIMPHGSPHP